MQTVLENAMQWHFADLKQAYIFGIYKALQKYDISTGVPFLIFKEHYVKNEIDKYIRAGIDSTHYTDFYRKYADKDGKSTSEDVTTDTTANPERLFFKQWQAEMLFAAYETLDYRERSMVADHLGFCPECYGIYELGKDENGHSVKLLRKRKAYIDLAAEHMLSSPDTAFQIVNSAYEKILISLRLMSTSTLWNCG